MGYAHGTRWTDELLEKKVREIMSFYKIDRMPSRKEIKQYENSNGLAEKLSRVGFKNFADKIGLNMKKSETLLGKTMESEVKKILEEKGFLVEQMPQNFCYDLLVNDIVKIDVKSSRLYKGKNGNFYTYSNEKMRFACDFYIFLALDDEQKILQQFVVPGYMVSKNCQFSIGQFKSKYDYFKDRYDLINKFIEQIKKVC